MDDGSAAERKSHDYGRQWFCRTGSAAGLQASGYKIDVFDPMKGLLVDMLRWRILGTARSKRSASLATKIRRTQSRFERSLLKRKMIRLFPDDILGPRHELIERFRGSDAVIHLAALPHPNVPGMTDGDFQRINFDGSVNVFEAARAAGVKKFIFASSAQVYLINSPTFIEQFPILESNYLPTLADGQSHYGFLKAEFERYLERHCSGGDIQAISLRMEYPGARSCFPWNFYISTSVENTVGGFLRALETDLGKSFDAFNLADRHVDPRIVDIQEFLRNHWPDIPNHTKGNECVFSTEKARSILGYAPKPDGTYYSSDVMW